MATKTLARWPWVGEVPYQALPHLRFFAYKIRVHEKVKKGEGEPGDEASETSEQQTHWGQDSCPL